MNESSIAIQGSVQQVPVLCQEQPFFINDDGDVAFQTPNNVILFLNYGWFSGISKRSAKEIVKSLNFAYKAGYEKDRKEWV